mgnify:CR=1 FL=1
MYAVVKTGGKQYRVAKDDVLTVEKLDAEAGAVIELAEVLAIIRPAKRPLLNESKEKIKKEVWVKPTDGSYYFKKAHAVSYAMACVVHMNLLCEQIKS